MNVRQAVKKLPTARCNPKAYPTSIFGVLRTFEQSFSFATIHQLDRTVVF